MRRGKAPSVRSAPTTTIDTGGRDLTAQTSTRTLQDVIDSVPNFVDYLYSNRKGSVVKDAVLRQPPEFVAPEFTTWRDEQRPWREGIAFYDQSFHMTTTYVRGKDAQRLISSIAVNGFDTFGVGRSRHMVVCSPDGYLMGDGVLYSVAPEELVLVGRAAGHKLVALLRRHGRLGRVDRGGRDLLQQSRPTARLPVSSGRSAGTRTASNSSPVLLCQRRRGRTSCLSPLPAIRSGPNGTRWRATRDASSSGRGMRVLRSRTRS